MSTVTQFLPNALPWAPPVYDDDVIYAVRALAHGIANKGQQERVWAYLMFVCGVDDLEFRPDNLGGDRASAFAAGKRFVGLMFRKMFLPELTPHAREPEEGDSEDPVPSRRRYNRPKQPAKATSRRK
jgi:hypothetical protein